MLVRRLRERGLTVPKIEYEPKRFSKSSLALIEQANAIIEEYQGQGFDLTLRQLYYQFVARGYIPNKQKEYKRLGSIINDARLAGLVDWEAIADRTRFLRKRSHWESAADIVGACQKQFAMDRWGNQKTRPEVWIEKDALVGVIQGVCEELDVPYFSCRGYVSQSEMWVAAQRHRQSLDADQRPVVLHLGDHDPSGIDMSRDIEDRLALFAGPGRVEVRRLALNMDQVKRFNPPPNPAKETDSRCSGYKSQFGDESWELDALEPKFLAELIRDAVYELRDMGSLEAVIKREDKQKLALKRAVKALEGVA